jgi:hypothetical protein
MNRCRRLSRIYPSAPTGSIDRMLDRIGNYVGDTLAQCIGYALIIAMAALTVWYAAWQVIESVNP